MTDAPSSTENETRPDHRLNTLLNQAGLTLLSPELAGRFATYLSLILRWNARTNLTAIRDEEGILSRHFVESIVCAQTVPPDTHNLLDFGSGAGFPGIPIALCRPEIAVTLAESQSKKAGFLREAIRTLTLNATVHSARAEVLGSTFDCVTMRAVDQMHKAVSAAAHLISPGGSLVLMTTDTESTGLKGEAGADFAWRTPVSLPFSSGRRIEVGVCSAGK